MKRRPIKIVEFEEHPMASNEGEVNPFDVVILSNQMILEDGFDERYYCEALLCKLGDIRLREVSLFLRHQCTMLRGPEHWLNSVEELLELNQDIAGINMTRLWKLMQAFDRTRDEIKHPKRNFDFEMVLETLSNMANFREQLKLLYVAKADFLQSIANETRLTFDKRIDIEIEKIEKLMTISNGNSDSEPYGNLHTKIRFNGKLNVLVDVFYQFMNQRNRENTPMITVTASTVAEFIAANFLDRNGKTISAATVRTMLSPSMPDKRPKPWNQINIEGGGKGGDA